MRHDLDSASAGLPRRAVRAAVTSTSPEDEAVARTSPLIPKVRRNGDVKR
jgi:hypothetical protein